MGKSWALGLVCLTGLAANAVLIGPGAWRSGLAGQNDFRLFYIGSRLAFVPGLYDRVQVSAAQQQLFAEIKATLMPVRLPFYYAFLSPLGDLPYPAAHVCWTALLLFAAIGFVWLAPPDSRGLLAIACCWSLPLVFSLAIGQDIAILLLLFAASGWALRRGSEVPAGLVLSLCLIKFHLFVLVPLVLVIKRKWNMLAGMGAGAALLLGISFFTAGAHWPGAWLAIVLRPEVSPGLYTMPNLQNLVSGVPAPALAEAVLAAAIVWAVVATKWQSFESAVAAALLGGLLLSPHTYISDCALLIPGIILWAPVGGFARALWITLLSIVPYGCILLGRGSITALWLAAVLMWAAVSRGGPRILMRPSLLPPAKRATP